MDANSVNSSKIEEHAVSLKKALDEAVSKITELDKERSNLLTEIARMNGAIIAYEDCARLLKTQEVQQPSESPSAEQVAVLEGEVVS